MLPHCTVCQAPISLRATTCAVCDAPAPPSLPAMQSGELRSGEFVRFQPPPEELRDLYSDLVRTLSPNIRVLGMIGEGGMAMVFVGRDSVLKRQVAIKVLSPTMADDTVARTRFTREAESIAAVSHPNIVNVFHVGEIPGRSIPYFVMQFVDGPTLGMGALRGRKLTDIRVRRLMADVAAGLAAAHRRKVFHRDIKPNNIVLDGETGRALVLDFGISAAYSSRRQSYGVRLTDEGMYLGTPTYMSPEQGNGEEVTGKSDVYSLGVLAFELLVGHPPFEGSPVSVMASHLRDVPARIDELRSDVSEELVTLIARCLEKNPARRPSAQEIVHFLNPTLRQVVEWPPPGMSRVRGSGARLLASATATTLAVALFFGALTMWPELAVLRRPGDEPHAVRSFVLGAGLALVIGLAGVFVFYVVDAVRRWRWAEHSGYPRWVVADVFADTRRDAGKLINGTDDFAFVHGPTRQMLMKVRRLRLALSVSCAVVAIAGVVHWVTRWASLAAAAPVDHIAARWVIPVLGMSAVAVLLAIPEYRVRRREHAKITGRPSGEKAPPLHSDLVDMWMASAERARTSLQGDTRHGVRKDSE
ncbi:MAG TPA: serine/threonine-protein kinase [Gemmatimonadaceae bacterium]|nr:serine/threonine-protein kinase [Gemmatimonadaceae bacterium]